MRFNLYALVMTGVAAGVMAGCGGGDDATGVMTYAIEVGATSLAVGQDSTVSLEADVRNVTQDRLLEDAPINFRSADYTIATVDNDGEVTGLRGGTTDILVVYRDDTARVPITVRANPITALRIQAATPFRTGVTTDAERRTINLGSGVGFDLTAGQTLEMAVHAADADDDELICLRCSQIQTGATSPSIQRRGVWTSTNEAVATVSNGTAFGRVTARAVGTTKIIFTVPGDELADTVTVNVFRRPVTGVDILIARQDDPREPDANAPLAIRRGGQLQLIGIPTVADPSGDAVDRRVAWSVPAGEPGQVDQLGLVIASGAASAVGDTLSVVATTVPIEGVDVAVSDTIKLVITNNQ